MLGSQTRRRGIGRNRQPRNRDLQVCWANVGKRAPCHITILQIAFTEKMDVVCVQEPFSFPGTRTQNHPGYDCYAPVDSWDSIDPEQREAERPRVMTYVRKGAGLKTQQRRPIQCRDLLWVDVNGFAILNVYRQPLAHGVIDYVTNLVPPPNCLVGGDCNVRHDMFEPGVQAAHQGAELARWASDSGMDFIGAPGEPTQRAGHVLDLTFSNIPFAQTTVRLDMHSGSDHETQVTLIPGRGSVPLEQFHYRVPDTELGKFAGLVRNGIARLPDPRLITDTEHIDGYTEALSEVLGSSVQTVGKPDRGGGNPAPWWTPECQEAYDEHLVCRNLYLDDGPVQATRNFYTTVRKAKRDYWKHVVNEVRDDKALYKVIGWHKLAPNLKAPPLEVNGTMVEDTMEKAEILRSEILDRFSAEDDLESDPLQNWAGTSNLHWEQAVSLEEVEQYTIGVSSTSPGTDRVTVRLLKSCWNYIKYAIHGLFSRCLALNYFPQSWKLAEVAMIPKVGKKDKTSVRSWRPIALLSCISKGLERIIAKRIAWTALANDILSPQHGGALPKRSAMDLVASFTHDVESAFAMGREVTMITMDVQGAFDALLVRRLLERMTKQGWPLSLLQLVRSFLTHRKVRVRLEKSTTPYYEVSCGTPQGSPLSPVLYMLYLAELLVQDPNLRFGYADDVCLYRASNSLDTNVRLLASDVRDILAWGTDNRIFFAPEKLEMIHLTRKSGNYAPQCVVNDGLTIDPITAAPTGDQPALRWLGVWFDRKLTFKRHVSERAAKARKVSCHIRGLARTADGPPASALRKAVVTCVLPSILYGTEAWYAGRTKPPRLQQAGRNETVSARVGWHVDVVDKTLALAARGVLPVWRTTPTVTLYRDSGLPSAEAALEESKLRFAMRLQTIDKQHPLVKRITPPMITRGRGAGTRQRPKTKVQTLGRLLPRVLRPTLKPPHFTPGCRVDPTGGLDKKTASAEFKKWWAALPPEDVTVFSDGSEQYIDGNRHVGYGYAVYQNGRQIVTGYGAINSLSHVFDGEAIGAWKGLQCTIRLPPNVSQRRIWLCIDSTSVIWCLRGDASNSSQWAFHNCQDVMQTHDVKIRWAPGHTGIEGNEAADKLADLGAQEQHWDTGPASEPTVSGIRSIFRGLRRNAQCAWWAERSAKLSAWYKKWGLEYRVKPLPELDLPRSTLHRLLALRSSHGDFSWYHRKFNHVDAKLTCSCGRSKDPGHLVRCRKTATFRLFPLWPQRPHWPPSNQSEAMEYLSRLMAKPTDFATFLKVTEFYSKICTR
jgi:ribonuclease HI